MFIFQNPVTRSEVEDLASAGDESVLASILGSRMTFGTAGLMKKKFMYFLKISVSAGLRAVMGAGYNKMNDLTIIQTTQVRDSTSILNYTRGVV